jgi:hypothetical protein
MPPRKQKPKKPPTLPPCKPWDIRPISPDGSPSAEDIYQAVGMALSKWELAEIQLSDLYLSFIGAYYGNRCGNSPRTAALRAYGAVTSFATRIQMVESAGRAFFNLKRRTLRDKAVDARVVEYERHVADDFALLLQEFRGFIARRNDIAHGFVGGTHREDRFFLQPPDYNPRKNLLGNGTRTIFESAIYHYTADDIHYYRRNFERLAQTLLDYIDRVLVVVGHDRKRDEEHKVMKEGRRPT